MIIFPCPDCDEGDGDGLTFDEQVEFLGMKPSIVKNDIYRWYVEDAIAGSAEQIDIDAEYELAN